MDRDPGENTLPWHHHAATNPVFGTTNLMGSHCDGRNPVLRGGSDEEGNHVNHHEDYGNQQAGYIPASYENQEAQHTGQVMRTLAGYRCYQSYDLSSSGRSANQLQYIDSAHPEIATGTSSRVTYSKPPSSTPRIQYPSHSRQPVSHTQLTHPEGLLLNPCRSTTCDQERPISPPLSQKPCQHLPSSTQSLLDTLEDLCDRDRQDHHLRPEDDLQALEFPNEFGFEAAEQFSPVQRRIQAFGGTMAENDWMESQQPVIVSKYFRNVKDTTFFKPVRDTGQWHFVKDDPAFADIATHGTIVAFEELYQRKDALVSSHNIADAYRRRSNSSTADDQHCNPKFPPENPDENGLSMEQEERLAALGVTGGPKPVKPRIPKKGEDRRRSRSPESIAQRRDGQSYRQRRYGHGSHAGRSRDGREDKDPRDRDSDSLGVTMDRDIGGNVEVELQRGQEKQSRGKGRKMKGRKTQQQAHKPPRKSRKRQHQ